MVVLFGSAGVYQSTNSKVISIAIIGFLYNLSREIIKDVTKNQYTKKIADIKNEKIKNSLLELSNLLKNNEK